MVKSFIAMLILIFGLSLSATSILALAESSYPKDHEKRYKKIAVIFVFAGIIVSLIGLALLFGN